jgi:hypothetical protein
MEYSSSVPERLLTINVGSSSLKAVLYCLGSDEDVELRATAERIGIPGSRLRITDADGSVVLDLAEPLPDHSSALDALFSWLVIATWTPACFATGSTVYRTNTSCRNSGRSSRKPPTADWSSPTLATVRAWPRCDTA